MRKVKCKGQDLSRYRNAPDRCSLGALGFQIGADDADDPRAKEWSSGTSQSADDCAVDATPQQVHRPREPGENGGLRYSMVSMSSLQGSSP